MSKSYGNYIGIDEPAAGMFGKVMSISDELMWKYYELLTDEDLRLVKALHPREAKVKLAFLLVAEYHGKEAAAAAREEFERVFVQKELPSDVPEYVMDKTETVLSIIVSGGLAKSGNEARRLIAQGAVFFEASKVEKADFVPPEGGILKVGPRKFLKVVRKK